MKKRPTARGTAPAWSITKGKVTRMRHELRLAFIRNVASLQIRFADSDHVNHMPRSGAEDQRLACQVRRLRGAV
jgi:hypothetical protein